MRGPVPAGGAIPRAVRHRRPGAGIAPGHYRPHRGGRVVVLGPRRRGDSAGRPVRPRPRPPRHPASAAPAPAGEHAIRDVRTPGTLLSTLAYLTDRRNRRNRMEELCDLMRREVHALHARMDHEVRCAPPPRQGSVPCHGRLARDRPRAFTFGSLGAAGGARRLDYAVQAAALLGGRRHRMGRGPYLHVFYRISWRTLPHMRSGLRPRAGLPSLAPAAAPRPFPRRTALRRRRVMQQLLDTVRIDQEGAASLAVDWAADTDCVDLVLGPCAPVASPVARRPSPAPPQRHHCPGWRCSPRSPRHDAPQWTRSRARWPTSGTRPAPPGMGSGRPPHDRARACTARPASGLGRMRLDPPARHARTATQGAAAAAQRRHTCTSALLFTLCGPFRVGGGHRPRRCCVAAPPPAWTPPLAASPAAGSGIH